MMGKGEETGELRSAWLIRVHFFSHELIENLSGWKINEDVPADLNLRCSGTVWISLSLSLSLSSSSSFSSSASHTISSQFPALMTYNLINIKSSIF